MHRIGRLAEMVVSSVMLAAASPFLSLLAVVIRIESVGPVIFRQVRVGRHGKPFTIYKYRSMVASTESSAPSPRDVTDARLTRVGRLMRGFGLDELPQLFNVFKGDMSFVGPRPQLECELRPFAATHAYLLEKRHRVRPGLTSAWAVSAKGPTYIPTVEMLESDCSYVDRRSPWLDVCIVFDSLLLLASNRKRPRRKRL